MAASVLDSGAQTFDRVEFDDGDGAQVFSYAEFMRLPLAKRIRLILAGKPRFFSGDVEVDKREALSLHS